MESDFVQRAPAEAGYDAVASAASGAMSAPAAPRVLQWLPHPEERPAIVRRGTLVATSAPSQVLRHERVVALSPTEVAVMHLLIRRGRASHAEIDAAMLSFGSKPACLDVLVFRIRRRFAEIGAPDPIERVRGWGMRLRVEPDANGSTALWIGAT